MISVVVPVYNEQKSVAELHRELVSVLKGIGEPFEIIFIDDGSTDGTLAELKKLKNTRVISFSRNFGKSQALQAGFKAAHGEFIFTMDGDLQDDPREIPNFLIVQKEEKADLVVGWKQDRRDGFAKRIMSKMANALTRVFTDTIVHDMNCGFKLYRKEAAQALDLYGDMHRYVPALISAMGFRVAEAPVHHRERKFGASKYGNFRRLPKSFFDFVTLLLMRRFIDRPMHFFGTIGIVLLTGGAGILMYLAYIKLFIGASIGSRPILLLGVLLVVIGVQLFSSGFLGELVIRQNGSRAVYTIREDITRP